LWYHKEQFNNTAYAVSVVTAGLEMDIIRELELFSCCSQIVVLFLARGKHKNLFLVTAENRT